MSFRRCPHHLIVCGPGLLAGQVPGIVSCHNDLTPTILKLAGSDRPDHDGSPIPLTQKDLATPPSLEQINVELLGFALSEGQIRLAIRQSCRYREQHLQGVDASSATATISCPPAGKNSTASQRTRRKCMTISIFCALKGLRDGAIGPRRQSASMLVRGPRVVSL